MAIIKLVTNGDKSETFKAISLAHAVTIVFGLFSVIGFMGTWLVASIHERGVVFDTVRQEIVAAVTANEALTVTRITSIDARLAVVEGRQRINEDVLNKSAGWIEAQKEKAK